MNEPKKDRDYKVGDKITFKTWTALRTEALVLSSLGYGVCVIGFDAMSSNTLTVTETPETYRKRRTINMKKEFEKIAEETIAKAKKLAEKKLSGLTFLALDLIIAELEVERENLYEEYERSEDDDKV